MSWEDRVLKGRPGAPLPLVVRTLLASQVDAWPLLKTGVESLGRARSREFLVGGFRMTARHIPHRIHSTTAEIDLDAIRARPCFLCDANLPEPQRAVAFGSEYLVLCNPFPILKDHLTIVRRDHVPQRITGAFTAMLELARALRGFMLLYNGGECGASAPDHMHFQACRPNVPLVEDVALDRTGIVQGYPPSAFVLGGTELARVGGDFDRLFAILSRLEPDRSEPMVNLVSFYGDDGWRVIVFPRVRHRPEVFHSGDLTWSPGAIDLCGMVVLPVERDLEHVSAELIEAGFREVSLAPLTLRRVAGEMEAG